MTASWLTLVALMTLVSVLALERYQAGYKAGTNDARADFAKSAAEVQTRIHEHMGRHRIVQLETWENHLRHLGLWREGDLPLAAQYREAIKQRGLGGD